MSREYREMDESYESSKNKKEEFEVDGKWVRIRPREINEDEKVTVIDKTEEFEEAIDDTENEDIVFDTKDVVRMENGTEGKYTRTEYSGTLRMRDRESGQMQEIPINRTVYHNNEIEPDLVVTEGTKYANGRLVSRDITNLELMKAGKAPFVRNADSGELEPIELHHMSGQETMHGYEYFNGEKRDGTILEIPMSVHDKYSRQLHEGQPSFRTDETGGKSYEAKKYEAFRRMYWKERANRFVTDEEFE